MDSWSEPIYLLSVIIVMIMAYKGLHARMSEVEEKWKSWAGLIPSYESTLQGEELKGRIDHVNEMMYKNERGYTETVDASEIDLPTIWAKVEELSKVKR